MCGIVGLFLKAKTLQPELGALTAQMLAVMGDRGPDSGGFAVYSAARPGRVKLTLRRAADVDGTALQQEIERLIAQSVELVTRNTHAVLSIPASAERDICAWLTARHPKIDIVGTGRNMELYKEVGHPAQVADLFGLAAMSGTHAIAHTRMATESLVTTKGAHPFSTGPDQCLVHNGSLSNHHAVRRCLEREGLSFSTDNDSEVAAGYLTWRMSQGMELRQALEASLADLDGFYTFVVGTRSGFAVLRDPIACKPAVMAETADYVAFGSEYRALAGLPGIEEARVFEPEPATVYVWEHD